MKSQNVLDLRQIQILKSLSSSAVALLTGEFWDSIGGGLSDDQKPSRGDKYRVMFKGWCKANRADYFTCTKGHARPPLADAAAGVSFRCVKSVGADTPPTIKENKD